MSDARYYEVIDRFLERADVPVHKRDLLIEYCYDRCIDFCFGLEDELSKHEYETTSAAMLVAGTLITQAGVDRCLEAWGIQGVDEDALESRDRLRLALYILIQNFKNLRRSIQKRKSNEV